jgi:hypothetical protein
MERNHKIVGLIAIIAVAFLVFGTGEMWLIGSNTLTFDLHGYYSGFEVKLITDPNFGYEGREYHKVVGRTNYITYAVLPGELINRLEWRADTSGGWQNVHMHFVMRDSDVIVTRSGDITVLSEEPGPECLMGTDCSVVTTVVENGHYEARCIDQKCMSVIICDAGYTLFGNICVDDAGNGGGTIPEPPGGWVMFMVVLIVAIAVVVFLAIRK